MATKDPWYLFFDCPRQPLALYEATTSRSDNQQESYMPREITIRRKSEPVPAIPVSAVSEHQPAAAAPEHQPATAAPEQQTAGLGWTFMVILCAIGLSVSAFMRWTHFSDDVSWGVDQQKKSDALLLLWLIPVCCWITVVAGVSRRAQQIAGLLTGLVPFGIVIYWYTQFGSNLFNILAYGAYISLALGAALFVMSRKLK